ncbi:glycosyltransferase involved in cell wall bisynthesis [Jatrophihabitans sp. GAS493]|uniref:glycosyltransferase family 4 protein n=1 Tax=Jatrophihabitans sp. GAS493 TaxID=1907575 RepID=UPI000BB9823E|nr:glycosyltransferase family 4 protein [Jatrophihabitans sp. GAS493]SOD71516.1 glycosyltransferase involved in cell wall bisynthesis [Jatrophihabitans sp. GAS493]
MPVVLRSRRPGVLVITNWRDLKHPQAGGAEVVCEELAAHFAEQGEDVLLLAAHVDGQRRTEVVNGYTIRRSGGQFTVYAAALLWLVRNRRRVSAVIDSQNGIPFFTPLALPRRTPILLLLHHVHQEQFGQYFPAPMATFGRWLESTGSRLVYRRRSIITVSPSTRHLARQQLALKGEMRVVPPGSRPAGALAAVVQRTEHPSIVTVGRLVPHKRTNLVIEAMPGLLRQYPQLKLNIVGSGPELDALRDIVKRLGVGSSVTFHSQCSNRSRDELLAASWLCINASSGEGWGLSVIEANAFGTPVLAFDRPGLRDSIRDGVTGWLAPEGSPLAAAAENALNELQNETTERDMQVSCRAWAANFTWAQMGEKIDHALLAEDARLELARQDRRTWSDLGVVVHVPQEYVPVNWSPTLRHEDRVANDASGISLFLAGADTLSVPSILARIGLPSSDDRPEISIRVARGPDFMETRNGTAGINGVVEAASTDRD